MNARPEHLSSVPATHAIREGVFSMALAAAILAVGCSTRDDVHRVSPEFRRYLDALDPIADDFIKICGDHDSYDFWEPQILAGFKRRKNQLLEGLLMPDEKVEIRCCDTASGPRPVVQRLTRGDELIEKTDWARYEAQKKEQESHRSVAKR